MHKCTSCIKKYPKCSPDLIRFHASQGKLVITYCSNHNSPMIKENSNLLKMKIWFIAGVFILSSILPVVYFFSHKVIK